MNNFIRVTCLGDIAPIKAAEEAILESPLSIRKNFERYFLDSDVVLANFEAPVSSAVTIREDKKYVLKTNQDVLGVFPKKTIFSIANNHVLDYKYEGLIETIANLSKKNLRFTGAGENLQAAGRPVVTECKGKIIGFIACADSRYQAATANSPGVYPAVSNLLIPKIKKLKTEVDIIYISIHMGMEYIPIPTPVMKELARQCHLAGANVVFFHHAHCVSGYTIRDNAATLWGLGNFVFPESENYPFKPWFEAASWRLTHNFSANRLDLKVTPFLINKKGLPEQPDKITGIRILERIEKKSRQINRRKNLGWARLKSILNISYLKIVFANYSDLARRQGFNQVVRQVISSIKVQFLKNY